MTNKQLKSSQKIKSDKFIHVGPNTVSQFKLLFDKKQCNKEPFQEIE